MRAFRLPGVYPPQRDTWLLAEVLSQEVLTPTTRVLDICAGTGAVGLTACRAGAVQVTAVDVSRRALINAWINARIHRWPLRLRRGDLIEPVRNELFDVIVANPPYVPAGSDRLPTGGAARGWDAGRDGRAVLDRLCVQGPEVLADGGRLFIVQSALSGVEKTIAMLEEQGLRAEVVRRTELPFGPVLSGRRAMLVARGVIRPDQCIEELAVIKASRM
ncbi:methyltransferase domain-containing protein [Rhodococcus oryzae]|uniref:Methyltransferase domain-containing protein n=2 Tax=Rhodococcus oryzae TaxID=2571143 RepID=A0ABY2RLM5_9NOCA|nr:methyltransferase domain-containing protein [Rhodococcus oryzae]